MITNPTPAASGSNLKGDVRQSSQVENPVIGDFTKRDSQTGHFIDQNADWTPFKGVRKEKFPTSS